MNPFLGVFFHWLGGLASGSFYVPYKGVRKWAWEVYWLVGGFFSWIIIIFSTMWGWILHEWRGASRKAHGLIAGGIALLILSTIVIGCGTYLKALAGGD